MVVTEDGTSKLVNDEHPEKELSSSEVTDDGISTYVREEQLKNDFSKTALIGAWIIALFNLLHSLKAFFPTKRTEAGISNSRSALHFKNAFSPI